MMSLPLVTAMIFAHVTVERCKCIHELKWKNEVQDEFIWEQCWHLKGPVAACNYMIQGFSYSLHLR